MTIGSIGLLKAHILTIFSSARSFAAFAPIQSVDDK